MGSQDGGGLREAAPGDKASTGGKCILNSVPNLIPNKPGQSLAGGAGDALAAPASGWDFGGEDAVSGCGANGLSPAEDAPLPTQPPRPPALASLLPRVQAQAGREIMNHSRERDRKDVWRARQISVILKYTCND